MKKAFFRKIIVVILLLFPITIIAQETKTENKGAVSSHAQRKAARQKWKDERTKERDEKKAISNHAKRLQTKKTLKSMKAEKRKSDKYRNNKKEFFLIRWFKR